MHPCSHPQTSFYLILPRLSARLTVLSVLLPVVIIVHYSVSIPSNHQPSGVSVSCLSHLHCLFSLPLCHPLWDFTLDLSSEKIPYSKALMLIAHSQITITSHSSLTALVTLISLSPDHGACSFLHLSLTSFSLRPVL